MNVAEEDDNLTQNDVQNEVDKLDKLSKESPDDLIEVMQSYSEENDSMSFNELLLKTPYMIVEKIEEKILQSVQGAVDAVEKKAKKKVDSVNKSAKKLLKGFKKKFKK